MPKNFDNNNIFDIHKIIIKICLLDKIYYII